MNLILTWAVLLSVIILTYILLDGFDLGIGILFPWFPSKHYRDIMMSTVAPVWDGNETWIVFGAAALYGAFPVAYGVLLPALYMPIMIMLCALILRGVAFEFRFKAEHHQKIWDAAFSFGSTTMALMQGMILGRFLEGYDSHILSGAGSYQWITPFSVLTGIAVVIGYALLGATWLVMRTEGPLQSQLFKAAEWLLMSTVACLGLVCVGILFLDSQVAMRWLEYRHILWTVPAITIALAAYAFYSLRHKQDVIPFFAAIGLFICSYAGFAVSLWPYIIPHTLTIWEAAAPAISLKITLIGTVVILPLLLIYTSYTYYVFRGKVTQSIHY